MTFKTERLSNRLVRREGFSNGPTFAHWCPACNEMHDYAVERPFTNGAQWSYDGNAERPSFTPSMNISWSWPGDEEEPAHEVRCHYFVTNGQIIYCGDCTHEFKGQTVDLPDIPQQVWLRAGIILS